MTIIDNLDDDFETSTHNCRHVNHQEGMHAQSPAHLQHQLSFPLKLCGAKVGEPIQCWCSSVPSRVGPPHTAYPACTSGGQQSADTCNFTVAVLLARRKQFAGSQLKRAVYGVLMTTLHCWYRSCMLAAARQKHGQTDQSKADKNRQKDNSKV